MRMLRGRYDFGPASLGGKLVLILTVVGLAGALGITLLLAGIITPSFNSLETRAVDGHVERTRAALGDYASKVENAVRDYGDWTQSYDYMAQPSTAFERDSFSPLAMNNLGVQGMAYVGLDGRIQIARWLDQGSGHERPDLRAAMIAMIRRSDLARVVDKGNSGHFYARLGPVVAAVGVAQVRRSDGTGTPRGYVLMARQITSGQIADQLRLDAHIDLSPHGDHEIATPGPTTVQISVPMRGADGHAVATTRFRVVRDVSLLGRRMLLLAVAGSTLLLLIVLLVLRRALARLVLAPLLRVERHMQRVRASGSMALFEDDGRRDEFGSLGRSLNAMLSQLKAMREQIEVQSFALGRSESAVAVMHNVRNALNPISTILSQGIAQAPPIDRSMVERALGELARDDLPAARREKLVAFVTAAFAAEGGARDTMRGELQVGREAMAHVLEIIGQQQKQAHERPTLEICDLSEIVARNATIARYAQGASIAFSFPAEPHYALANRVILSQVIGNLLGNAAEAIAASGCESGSINVTIVEGQAGVVLAIRDDGEGFDAETGATLFQRGFSTRAHKSGGLGLHWCANSMTAMEGALRLESEGRGRGAAAILTLKAAPSTPIAAAA
ncbi:HAMP domain-containing protein [Sphingomonas sp. MA1305]|uniref:sensor histidine kinase n=1 Tax=Sphingomonas sp. MA1305 TaxID=2479204 RepID=UPI0018DFEA03|nr:CHASE4 domain-containing protein [Sphingomonas sp. MA1305]MBI0476644.1 HAMP domain-containing protein [Sphingomonas sp. MA1305]